MIRYPYSHAVIALSGGALLTAVGLPGFAIMAAFYGLREVWQWKWLGLPWDAPGFHWGVWPAVLAQGGASLL